LKSKPGFPAEYLRIFYHNLLFLLSNYYHVTSGLTFLGIYKIIITYFKKMNFRFNFLFLFNFHEKSLFFFNYHPHPYYSSFAFLAKSFIILLYLNQNFIGLYSNSCFLKDFKNHFFLEYLSSLASDLNLFLIFFTFFILL
jgi:hypothetical protein